MDRDDAERITASFDQLLLTADTAAALFYGRLFELAPDARPLFQHDMREQGRKFVAMLELIVRGQDDRAALAPALAELGQAHVAYGVRAEHYETVRVALFWALRQTLRERFTPDVELAWQRMYAAIATAMQSPSRA